MDDVFTMTVGYSAGDLAKVVLGLFLRNEFFFPEVVKHLTTLKVLHDNVDLHIFEHVAVDDFDNIGVVEGLEVLYLTKDHVNIGSTGWVIKRVHIFYTLMILTAASSLVIMFSASITLPNPPSPRGLRILYSPKFDSKSKSSPRLI